MFNDLERALAEMARIGAQKRDIPQPNDAALITLTWDYASSVMDVVIEAKRLIAREKEKRIGLDLPAEHV